VTDFERDGFTVLPKTIDSFDIDILREEFSHLNFRAGARPFALSEAVKKQIASGCFKSALFSLGIFNARPVRLLAFDKTPENNWNLGWHQDRVIAVRHRLDVPGYDNWTVKNNTPHVEAPAQILSSLFSLRLHLDECDQNNGALKGIAESFKRGKLKDREVDECAARGSAIVCEAKLGEIVAMKALTVHASEPSKVPHHRRVLHVDFCSAELPGGLQWALSI
jgi:hypothetical protein